MCLLFTEQADSQIPQRSLNTWTNNCSTTSFRHFTGTGASISIAGTGSATSEANIDSWLDGRLCLSKEIRKQKWDPNANGTRETHRPGLPSAQNFSQSQARSCSAITSHQALSKLGFQTLWPVLLGFWVLTTPCDLEVLGHFSIQSYKGFHKVKAIFPDCSWLKTKELQTEATKRPPNCYTPQNLGKIKKNLLLLLIITL